jgi:hypothetical protein
MLCVNDAGFVIWERIPCRFVSSGYVPLSFCLVRRQHEDFAGTIRIWEKYKGLDLFTQLLIRSFKCLVPLYLSQICWIPDLQTYKHIERSNNNTAFHTQIRSLISITSDNVSLAGDKNNS